MPIIKSARKRVRVSAKKRERNKAIKSRYKTAIKKFEEALEDPGENLEELHREAVKQIDKAATKNVLPKNKASRLKSQLAKKKNAAGANTFTA